MHTCLPTVVPNHRAQQSSVGRGITNVDQQPSGCQPCSVSAPLPTVMPGRPAQLSPTGTSRTVHVISQQSRSHPRMRLPRCSAVQQSLSVPCTEHRASTSLSNYQLSRDPRSSQSAGLHQQSTSQQLALQHNLPSTRQTQLETYVPGGGHQQLCRRHCFPTSPLTLNARTTSHLDYSCS